jgi:hypothetical protein
VAFVRSLTLPRRPEESDYLSDTKLAAIVASPSAHRWRKTAGCNKPDVHMTSNN